MRIEIFDVGHGGCAVITGPNGKQLMLDCGYGTAPFWFPSEEYRGKRLECLAFMNLDEDHLEDLPRLWKNADIGAIYSNPTVTDEALASMKRQHGMNDGVRFAHVLLNHFGSGRIGALADLGSEVRVWSYCNTYGDPFTDTNNLSLAVFVSYCGFTTLFAGDLETRGWKLLLQNPFFRRDLAKVSVLIASHHGRENGKCDEVLQIVRPDIAVFSDDAKRYSTQETDAWYRYRVTGIPVIDQTPDLRTGLLPRRHVYTTRRDGTLTIDVNRLGGYLVRPSRAMNALGIAEFTNALLGLRTPSSVA